MPQLPLNILRSGSFSNLLMKSRVSAVFGREPVVRSMLSFPRAVSPVLFVTPPVPVLVPAWSWPAPCKISQWLSRVHGETLPGI